MPPKPPTAKRYTFEVESLRTVWVRKSYAVIDPVGPFDKLRVTGKLSQPNIVERVSCHPELVEGADWVNDRVAFSKSNNPSNIKPVPAKPVILSLFSPFWQRAGFFSESYNILIMRRLAFVSQKIEKF
jgi:hypothetical protein